MANDLFVELYEVSIQRQLLLSAIGRYTFEDQLNQITERMMDKPIKAYDSAELNAMIPMMILSPTIVNDGRKLYIAATSCFFHEL